MLRTFSFASLLVLLSSALAFAQFRTVTVQNANGNPVPTTIQNTPTVNINGTVPVSGTVSATLTGTPAVTISGTPSVSVSGTPTVSVTNLPTGTGGPAGAAVVLTKNLDEPAQQPFQTIITCTSGAAGASQCTNTGDFPAGKVFVIEYLVLQTTAPGPTVAMKFELATAAGGNAFFYPYATGFTSDTLSEHLVRIYAEHQAVGGSLVIKGTAANGISPVIFTAMISGHLVNVP
jgi:hypothetical protein